jgi:actin-like ATPase involved in cell morphogenesis
LGSTNGAVEKVPARTVERGEPVEVEVNAALVNEAMSEVVSQTVRLIQECLADAPPDLSQDVSARGLNLVGGHALLNDFAELIAANTGVDVTLAPHPDVVVIQGLLQCLDEMSALHALFRGVDD